MKNVQKSYTQKTRKIERREWSEKLYSKTGQFKCKGASSPEIDI
jgi:hypothetical protein